MRILIAEDEKDLLELLRDNLSREGHDVFISENGKAAWDIFKREKIELCILDVMMQEMDGLQLVQIEEEIDTNKYKKRYFHLGSAIFTFKVNLRFG